MGWRGGGPAHAQGEDHGYVDVALILETPEFHGHGVRDLTVIVMNLGSRTAYDVEVVVDVVYPENTSLFRFTPDVPIGTATLENGGYSLRWTIPELGGLKRVEVTDDVTHELNLDPAFDVSEYPHECYGEVTTASFESDLRKENNTDRVWSVLTNEHVGRTEPAQPKHSVSVSVDERNPSPGDIVNFTVTANNPNRTIIDQKVAIELTDGLTVSGTPTYDPTTADGKPDSVSYSSGVFNSGVFNIGSLKYSDWTSRYSVTLPITLTDDAVVNEQCLTATITGNPPPEAGPRDDDTSDNVRVFCLDGRVSGYYTSDDLSEFISHPCVGNSDFPCDDTDDVRVRAIDTTTDPQEALGPGTPVVHIPDTSETRKYDADVNSVNAEEIVSWPILVQMSYRQYTDEHVRWTDVSDSFSYEMAGKDDNFDKLHMRVSWANALLNNDQRQATFVATYDPGGTAASNGPFDFTAEFEKLGTYEVQYSITATHDNNTVSDTSDDVEYTDTGSYTFHVGPMADLVVRDGGASAYVAANQHALTIVAVNNGPDIPDTAQVTGLPTGAQVLHISQGAYNATTGEWNIGELEVRGRYRSRGEPEPTLVLSASAGDTASVSIANSEDYEVCVAGKDNPGDLAHTTQSACEGDTDSASTNVWHTAVCVNTADGELDTTFTTEATCDAETDREWTEDVCALSDGSVFANRTEAECSASWNSTPWYDYDTDNSTATITAKAGTGGVGEGIPTLQMPTVHAPAVDITWSEVEFLYGVPVKDYDVQWSNNGVSGWTQLETELTLTELFDITIQSGVTRYYRVRAVNEAGVPGPWSKPIAAMVEQQATAGAPDAPALTAVPNEPNGRTEILITWSKPVENGSAITSYTMQVADSASGPWADVSRQPGVADVSYVYSDGLTGGTRKYFRMLATNMCDGSDPFVECDSLWSDVVDVTTRAPGISSAPTGVSAVPDGDAAIDVSWSAPADDGGTPITRYEVQWSADGVGGWNSAGNTPDGTTLTLKNTGMTFGTTRYYRVAARNSRGLSAWSDPPYASATTLSGVPGQPSLTVSATDAHTIGLTWTVPADNGDPITGYNIEWSADGSAGNWNNLTSPGATATSYDDAPLNPGTQRHYRIRAVNGTGQGSWSTARNATTPPAVPGAPTNVQAAANGENAIDITWEPPSDDGGTAVTGYELHVSTDSGSTYSRLTSPSASARSYTHSGLQPGDGRHYKLLARNRAGSGNFSSAVFASTLSGVPTAPSLTARANGSTEIKLSWTKPNDKGSEILRYELEESDDGSAWSFLSSNISNNDSEYVHTGLSGGTTRHYRIRAVNANGAGQWSATRNARTYAGGPDAPVLTLTVAGDNQIDLGWTVPADNGSAIRGYWVERSVDGDEPWERLSSNTTATTYSDTDLYRGMTRYYRVAAFNGAGTGPYSGVESATTTGTPATAPSVPTLLRFSAVGRNQVTLAWDPPTDDGGAPVSGYEYEVARPCPPPATSTCDFTGNDIKTTSGTSASITGLSAQGDYYFQVRTVNPVGKGDWSAEIRATLYPSLSGLLQVSPVTVDVNEGATASYTVRLSHAPPHPVQVQLHVTGSSGADELTEAVRLYTGHYLVPDGWTHAGGEDWSQFAHNWRQGMRVQFTAPEDTDTDDDIATFDHAVFAASHSRLGLSKADWLQAWYDSTAYNLVECTGNCNDANLGNDSVQRNTLTGAGVKVTVRDND